MELEVNAEVVIENLGNELKRAMVTNAYLRAQVRAQEESIEEMKRALAIYEEEGGEQDGTVAHVRSAVEQAHVAE